MLDRPNVDLAAATFYPLGSEDVEDWFVDLDLRIRPGDRREPDAASYVVTYA